MRTTVVAKLSCQNSLGDVACGSFSQGLRRDFFASLSGHQNDRQSREFFHDPINQLQTVAFRHLQIGDDSVGHLLANVLKRLVPIAGEMDGHVRFLPQKLACHQPIGRRVIHHQNCRHGRLLQVGDFICRVDANTEKMIGSGNEFVRLHIVNPPAFASGLVRVFALDQGTKLLFSQPSTFHQRLPGNHRNVVVPNQRAFAMRDVFDAKSLSGNPQDISRKEPLRTITHPVDECAVPAVKIDHLPMAADKVQFTVPTGSDAGRKDDITIGGATDDYFLLAEHDGSPTGAWNQRSQNGCLGGTCRHRPRSGGGGRYRARGGRRLRRLVIDPVPMTANRQNVTRHQGTAIARSIIDLQARSFTRSDDAPQTVGIQQFGSTFAICRLAAQLQHELRLGQTNGRTTITRDQGTKHRENFVLAERDLITGKAFDSGYRYFREEVVNASFQNSKRDLRVNANRSNNFGLPTERFFGETVRTLRVKDCEILMSRV